MVYSRYARGCHVYVDICFADGVYLRENFNGVRVQCGDFMEWQPVQYYSRIIMNPPFSHGQDIRHILR
ncbi:class I SAM-dependent methyltransferase, partial [Escherichia coli]